VFSVLECVACCGCNLQHSDGQTTTQMLQSISNNRGIQSYFKLTQDDRRLSGCHSSHLTTTATAPVTSGVSITLNRTSPSLAASHHAILLHKHLLHTCSLCSTAVLQVWPRHGNRCCMRHRQPHHTSRTFALHTKPGCLHTANIHQQSTAYQQ
jgi:hypothetical protein